MKLDGRIAIVTGGAGGIGQGVVKKLAKEGAKVIVADVIKPSLPEMAAFIKTDVRKSSEVNAMVESVLRDFGKIDILVNCAGGAAREKATLFKDSLEETWDFVIELNLKGTRNCCRAVIGPMMQRRYGKIVNIASTSATGAHPTMSDYAAAKAGVIAFTRVLALEAISYGINANCVSPGPTDTPPGRKFATPEVIEQRGRSTGFGRLGRPEEIANAVAFLASDEASFITGQNYGVCGMANIPDA